MPQTDRTLSRRTVTKGIAWTVPAVTAATAAPAFAISGCVVKTNFDALTVGTCQIAPSVITFAPSAVTATISYASTGQGGDNTPGDTCRVERTSSTPQWNYIELEMLQGLKEGDSITVTITLSQAMENLSFTLHDIDSTQGGWRDTVIVNTLGFTLARGSNIQGAGTSGDPIRPINVGDTPISSGLGDVRITWPGPIQTVTFTYRAGITGNSQNQHIGLGNISFSDCIAAPDVRARTASRQVSVSSSESFGAAVVSVDGSTDQ